MSGENIIKNKESRGNSFGAVLEMNPHLCHLNMGLLQFTLNAETVGGTRAASSLIRMSFTVSDTSAL